MTEKRVQFSNIVQNQLPAYVREEFPLISEFLSQYYISQEFQGAPIDLIQNIDQYVKVDEITNVEKGIIFTKEKGGKEKNFALLVHGTQGEGMMSQNKRRDVLTVDARNRAVVYGV